MIITDLKGGKLRLTKTTLTELTGTAVPGDKWTLDLTELTKDGATSMPVESQSKRCVELFLHRIDRDLHGRVTGACTLDTAHLRIGCRVFTIRTFGRIMRAALDLKEKGTRKSK